MQREATIIATSDGEAHSRRELTPKMRLFVAKYLADPTKSAREVAAAAGYGSPRVMGPRVLKNPHVLAMISTGADDLEHRPPKSRRALTPKMLLFVEEYLADPNRSARALAEAAGYRNPRVIGPRLLKDTGVQAMISVRTTQKDRHKIEPQSGKVRHLSLVRRVGRPSQYSPELAEELCFRIATSHKSLEQICREEESFPSYRTVYRWFKFYPEFKDNYRWARELQADTIAYEVIEIADDSSLDMILNDRGKLVRNPGNIQRSRLRCKVRMWLASKLAPRTYGKCSR